MSDRLKTPMLPVVVAREDAPVESRRAHIPVVRSSRRAARDEDEPPASQRGSNETVRTMAAALPLPTDRATVTVIHGVNSGQVFTIERESAVVGRDGGVDFVIDDPAISRRHCRFRLSEDRIFVEDLGSANGTFVSGQRLRPGQLFELFSGDRLQVGPTVVLRFSLSDRLEEEMQRRLYEAATRDALTGAFSRSYLNERLSIEIASARRHRAELSFMILSIDRYAEHARVSSRAGPQLVRGLAAKLATTMRVDDVLGRFGAERFAIVVRAANVVGASVLAERFRGVAREVSPGVTLSVGVASLSELKNDEDDEKELIALTEARLAEAIREGGDRTQATWPDVAVFRRMRR